VIIISDYNFIKGMDFSGYFQIIQNIAKLLIPPPPPVISPIFIHDSDESRDIECGKC